MAWPLPVSPAPAEGSPGHRVTHHPQVHQALNEGWLVGRNPLRLKGAVGNSDHNTGGGNDDTNALKDTIAEAQQAGVPMLLEAGKTYRTREPLDLIPDNSKLGCSVWGEGGSGSNKVVMLPNIVFDPAGGDGGGQPIIDIPSTGNNIPGVQLVNFRIAGRDIPNTDGVRWGPDPTTPTASAKPDTGSCMLNVHIAAVRGHGVRFDGVGITNLHIDGGRQDKIGGYAFYCRVASQTELRISNYTWDAWGTPGVPDGLGFLHMNANAGGSTAQADVMLDNVHTEHSSLLETDAAGTDPADRRGILAFTIDAAGGLMHFTLKTTQMRVLGWQASDLSASLVQMLGGTADQRRARIVWDSDPIRSLFGDGTSSTGHVLPIGNIPTAYKSPWTNGVYQEIHYPLVGGGGGIFGSETPHVWGPVMRGNGTPEAVIKAPIGTLYCRNDGGAGTTLYVKESGTGNTGWVAK